MNVMRKSIEQQILLEVIDPCKINKIRGEEKTEDKNTIILLLRRHGI